MTDSDRKTSFNPELRKDSEDSFSPELCKDSDASFYRELSKDSDASFYRELSKDSEASFYRELSGESEASPSVELSSNPENSSDSGESSSDELSFGSEHSASEFSSDEFYSDSEVPSSSPSPSSSLSPSSSSPEHSFVQLSLTDSLSESGIDIDGLDLSGLMGNEPVEILVELSRAGRIDPWNIDIVEVTDSFLTRIEEMKLMDLRVSGRTLLYACILLRMKSMEIDTEDEEEPYEESDDDFGSDDPAADENIDITTFPAPELPIRRSPRRPVTLKELIGALKNAEKSAAKKRERTEEKEIRRFVEADLTTDDVIGIAHDEAILQRTGVLSGVLKEMFREKERVSLEEVISREGSERIMDYVTLLFLTNLKEIDLYQEELFGPLYIYPKCGDNAEIKSAPDENAENSTMQD